MGRWHVRHQLGTSWCLLRGGCQRKQELWLHGEAWHRQLILWLDWLPGFFFYSPCMSMICIHIDALTCTRNWWIPAALQKVAFSRGVFEGGRGDQDVMSKRWKMEWRWFADESSASDLLRNVTCKPLLFVSFCQVALLYLYINMLKPIAGRISIWMEIIEIDWNFLSKVWGAASRIRTLHGSLYPGSASCWGCQEIIETTKIDECRDRWIGILIWHFVHHTPVHLFGRGPWFV